MVSMKTIHDMKKEYETYLKKCTHYSEKERIEKVKAAFFLYEKEISNHFWSFFISEESLRKVKAKYKQFFKKQGNPNGEELTNYYYQAMKECKRWIDESFGGIKQRVGSELYAERMIYSIAKTVYQKEMNLEEGATFLVKKLPCFGESSHRLAILLFADMLEGKAYTCKADTTLTLYFLKRIEKEYDFFYVKKAVSAVCQNLQYIYERTGDKSALLRIECEKLCQNWKRKYGEAIYDFSDAMFQENIQKQERNVEALSYTKKDFLDEVYLEEEQYEKLYYLLKRKKNIILEGPPGVGKTFCAKRFAYSVLGCQDTDRVKMLQFHQSYSYEDFVIGFRPVQNGFELRKGPFYEICDRAKNDKDHSYFLLIDEMNRGDVGKIFGELFTLLEADKRGESMQLLYSEEEFFVPENLYVIGMMNTADRSIAFIDYALRRRFAFFEVSPAFSSKGFRQYQKRAKNEQFHHLIKIIEQINQEIKKDELLGSGFQIGHSYFCTEKVTNEWMKSVVEFEIIPLLKEYWFEEEEKCQEWIKRLNEAIA